MKPNSRLFEKDREMTNVVQDTGTITVYEFRRSLHSPAWVIFGVLQPILWLLLFAPMLRNVFPGNSLQIFAPGMLFLVVIYGNLYQGFDLVAAMRAGVLERLAVTPASRSSLLLGRLLRDAVVTLLQGILMMAAAWLMGMHASIGGVALTLVLIMLVGMWGAALSYGLALRIRDESGLASSVGFLALPLMLISGVILPFSLAPGWLQGLAHVNPFYYVVEAGRHLFAGQFDDGFVPLAFALTIGITALTLAWAVSGVRHAAI
ncbi:ABC transporter permease [Nocardia sp. NPDC051052]|uniref:ABC transporter permease n=1 Tax=Nocardia sp. NPDC051052 TaxID=3364322 RepID=UPI0037BCA160